MLEPDDTWMVHAPYVLLPTVLVMTAVLLHVVTIPKVLRETSR